MLGIEQEVLVFAVAVLSGAGLRLLYRCLGCFREIVRHSLIAIGIEDITFWIFCALYLFVQIYQTSNGSIRWYFILGIVVGAVLMTVFLRKLKKLFEKIYTKKS